MRRLSRGDKNRNRPTMQNQNKTDESDEAVPKKPSDKSLKRACAVDKQNAARKTAHADAKTKAGTLGSTKKCSTKSDSRAESKATTSSENDAVQSQVPLRSSLEQRSRHSNLLRIDPEEWQDMRRAMLELIAHLPVCETYPVSPAIVDDWESYDFEYGPEGKAATLGQGRHSKIFSVKKGSQTYALKVYLKPTGLLSLLNEVRAQLAANTSGVSPKVVGLFPLASTPNLMSWGILMRPIRGKTLRAFIQDNQAAYSAGGGRGWNVTRQQWAGIVIDIAKQLQHLQTLGIEHFDMRIEKVLISGGYGEYKPTIIGFRMARPLVGRFSDADVQGLEIIMWIIDMHAKTQAMQDPNNDWEMFRTINVQFRNEMMSTKELSYQALIDNLLEWLDPKYRKLYIQE